MQLINEAYLKRCKIEKGTDYLYHDKHYIWVSRK